jgi:hypothetical protein
MEHTDTHVDDLQKRIIFIIKNFAISTQPKRPYNGQRSHPNKCSKPEINTIKPNSKDVGYTSQRTQVGNYLVIDHIDLAKWH